MAVLWNKDKLNTFDSISSIHTDFSYSNPCDEISLERQIIRALVPYQIVIKNWSSLVHYRVNLFLNGLTLDQLNYAIFILT